MVRQWATRWPSAAEVWAALRVDRPLWLLVQAWWSCHGATTLQGDAVRVRVAIGDGGLTLVNEHGVIVGSGRALPKLGGGSSGLMVRFADAPDDDPYGRPVERMEASCERV